MFSFFILYKEQKETQIFNMKNVERHLPNSYEVIIPSKINSFPKEAQYKKILDSSNGQDSSIYFTRIERNGKEEKIIKYIYSTNDDYIDNFKLVWGKKLDKTLMDSDYFLSTEDTGEENQIGRIASFDGINMEIRTIQSMLNEGLFLDGPCTVTVPEGKGIEFFTDGLKDGLGIRTIDASVSRDIGGVVKNSHLEIAVLFFMIMLLILYDVLKSYKKVAVEKLLGFSTLDIWKKRIVIILLLQFITIIVSIIIMSLILFKEFNIYHLYFLKDLVLKYIVLTLLTFITASIPFVYVGNIKVTVAIKNNQPTKEILFFNTIIKVILFTGLIFFINKQVINYDNIKKAFDDSYKKWEEVSNYRVLSLNKMSLEMQFSDTNIEIYKYFNERGAIFAEFESYTKISKELNKDLPDTNRFALINSNYLLENPAYDLNGDKVSISENDDSWILLVPDKYKDKENEIKEFHQRWINSFPDIRREIKIIWTKSGQKFFSYNFMVNGDEGYYVTDPILFVGTEKGGLPMWNSQLFNVQGNPFKVKVDPSMTDKEFIEPILNEFGYLSYGLNINYADEQVASTTKEYKEMFVWIVTGILSTLLIIVIIIIQNVYNFFEQFKIRLAIKKLYGYGNIEKYKEYFILIMVSWVITILISATFSLASLKVIIIVFILGFSIESMVSLIMLNRIEKKKIVEFIKGGA